MKNITPKTTQHILLFSATSKLLLADYINWFIDYLRSTTDEIKDIATALYNQKLVDNNYNQTGIYFEFSGC